MTSTIPGSVSAGLREQVVQWRRHLHRKPELSLNEDKTAQFVHDTLAGFGGLGISRPAATSIMVRLVTGRAGPVPGIRADMDALPITEETGLPFASRNAGVMHACGHDGHTAVLLGAVRALLGMRDALWGEIRFFFQHAEEILPGGAEEMVQRGVMDGAQVVTNLHQIVSRNVPPVDAVVLSVTQFHAGTAHNVIPGSAELNGTVRTLDPDLRTRMPQLMERVIRGVTEAHGAGALVQMRPTMGARTSPRSCRRRRGPSASSGPATWRRGSCTRTIIPGSTLTSVRSRPVSGSSWRRPGGSTGCERRRGVATPPRTARARARRRDARP
jgi:metal-dependent amidase/aminoacylase/carboxypeptidase family protein